MHQHGVTIQSSVNLAKTFLRIYRIWKLAQTWILERVIVYLPSFISQIKANPHHPLGNRHLLHRSPALGIYVAFLGEGEGGFEYFLELHIVIVTDLVPRSFAVISFNIIIIYTYYIHHIHDYVQFDKTSHTSSSCRKSLISLFNANRSYVVGKSVSKDNNFESFWLTLSLVMWHFQKEPNDMLWFFFCQGRESCGGGGEDILSIIYLLFISNYLEFKHYFSLITSSDVKTVKKKKKIISSSEYIFLFWLKPYKTTTLGVFFFLWIIKVTKTMANCMQNVSTLY